MIVLKSFVVDQVYKLKKNSDEEQNLPNNENKVLLNNLFYQTDSLKKWTSATETLSFRLNVKCENSKFNNEIFKKKQ